MTPTGSKRQTVEMDQPGDCYICGNITFDMDLDFGTHVCEGICSDALWFEWSAHRLSEEVTE